MRKLLGIITGLAIFIAWLSLVGNPHVVETAIGLALALFCGWWVYSKLGALFRSKPEQHHGSRR